MMVLINTADERRWSPRHLSVCLMLWLLFTASCNEQDEDLVHSAEVGQWKFVTERHGLSSDYINTIFEDSQGKVWVGTAGGLSVIDKGTVVSYSVLDGLLDNRVYAISEDRDGAIWIGTHRGVNIIVEGAMYYFRYFRGASVFALAHLQNNEGMLIGTGGFGIYYYDYATPGFSLFDITEECDPCNSINSMYQSKDGSLWVASFAGARRMRGTFVTRFDTSDGLPGNIATTITEDSWGNIWVGTVEGKTISKIKGNTVSQVSFNNGAEQNFIFGIQEDNNGGLWVGTVSNGLFHYDGAIMKQIQGGPPDTTITALYKDSRGNLWVGTSESGLAIYITNPVR